MKDMKTRPIGNLPICAGLLFLLLPAGQIEAAVPTLTVKPKAVEFSPVLGQQMEYVVENPRAGKLTLEVLDRDGYLVRSLAKEQRVRKGQTVLRWDGKADSGEVVPDEAYSTRAVLAGDGKRLEWFPANGEAEMLETVHGAWDPASGTMTYTLPKAARVHAQIGYLREDPETKKRDGPVLKTLVNRQPRAAGKTVEVWNGFDEGNTVYLGNSGDLSMSVMATSLADGAVMTSGNQKVRFLEWARRRTGTSRITWKPAHIHHHSGLTVEQDVSPSLRLEVENGTWKEAEKLWEVNGEAVNLVARPSGETARAFCAQPGVLHVFRGVKRMKEEPSPAGCEAKVTVPLEAGVELIAVDWSSTYGPTAPGVVRVRKAGTK